MNPKRLLYRVPIEFCIILCNLLHKFKIGSTTETDHPVVFFPIPSTTQILLETSPVCITKNTVLARLQDGNVKAVELGTLGRLGSSEVVYP